MRISGFRFVNICRIYAACDISQAIPLGWVAILSQSITIQSLIGGCLTIFPFSFLDLIYFNSRFELAQTPNLSIPCRKPAQVSAPVLMPKSCSFASKETPTSFLSLNGQSRLEWLKRTPCFRRRSGARAERKPSRLGGSRHFVFLISSYFHFSLFPYLIRWK